MSASQSYLTQSRNVRRSQPLLREFSIQATLPTEAHLEELRDILAPQTPVYLSAPLGHSSKRLAAVARQVRNSGFEPVPHVAARHYLNRASLQDFIEYVTGEAGVQRAMVIAGDVDSSAIPFPGQKKSSRAIFCNAMGLPRLAFRVIQMDTQSSAKTRFAVPWAKS
jgi:5,10-methylenetetrahydrofolate reductase